MRLAVEVIQDKSVLCFQVMLLAIRFLFVQKAARGPHPFILQKLSCEFVRDGCLLYIYLINFFAFAIAALKFTVQVIKPWLLIFYA